MKRFTGEEAWLAIPVDRLQWSDLPSDFRQRSRAVCILALRQMAYAEYLQTAHWHFIRRRTMRLAGWLCRLCSQPARDVHHLTYDRKGMEHPQDVMALCRACHDTWHRTWALQARAGMEAA